MSAGSTPTGFDISDIFIRIVPGGILVFPLSFLIGFVYLEHITDFPGQNVYIVISALVAFLLGEVINMIRISEWGVPNHFRKVLYTEKDDEKYLGPIDTCFVKLRPEWVGGHSLFDMSDKRMSQTLHNRFDLSNDFERANDYYNLLKSDLSSNKSLETKRLESLYIFFKNMILALSFLSFCLIIFDLHLRNGNGISAVREIIGTALLFSIVGTLLSYVLLLSADPAYVESLLSDYFVYVKQND